MHHEFWDTVEDFPLLKSEAELWGISHLEIETDLAVAMKPIKDGPLRIFQTFAQINKIYIQGCNDPPTPLTLVRLKYVNTSTLRK